MDTTTEYELLFPLDGKCMKHTKENLNLYCRVCSDPLCAECWELDHEDHDVEPLKKQQGFLQQSLHRCLSLIKNRKNETDALVKQLDKDICHVQTEKARMEQACQNEHDNMLAEIDAEYKRKNAEENKRHKAEMALLRRDVGEKTLKLEETSAETKGQAEDLGTLLFHLQLLTPQSPVGRVAKGVKAADAALDKHPGGNHPTTKVPPATSCSPRLEATAPPDYDVACGASYKQEHQSDIDVRQLLQEVATQAENERFTPASKLKDPVTVFTKCIDVLQDYAMGYSDQFPGSLQGPINPKTVYKWDLNTYISSETSQAAAAVLGSSTLPKRTMCNGHLVLTLGQAQPQHVGTSIYEEPRGRYTSWWLPAGVSLGEAATLALGYKPDRITHDCGGRTEDLSMKNVLDWCNSETSKGLYAWSM